VDAATIARRPEFADRTAFAVRRLDREDVDEERDAAVAAAERIVGAGCGGLGQRREEEESQKGGAPRQWCSITRSTMWYSFASSALMK
jgi:hypothetical protein